MEDDEILCSSCEKQKKTLYPVQSKLVSVQLYMCQTCLDADFEPRWTIVMAGRTQGISVIRDYIVNNLYYGERIRADEIIRGR